MERDYYERTRIFPVMHLVALRRSVHEKYPFVATSLYQAFEESKNMALAKMRYLGALRYMLPWMTSALDEIDEVFGGDPWPSGVEANRPTLEALVTYLHEQFVTDRRMDVDELFVPDAPALELAIAGVGVDPRVVRDEFDQIIGQVLGAAEAEIPAGPTAGRVAGRAGRAGLHTEWMGHLLAEMQSVARMHPEGVW